MGVPETGRLRGRYRLALAAVVAVVVSLFGAPVAHAAAPAAPTLVAPANSATGVPIAADLRVAASDPDGGPVEVTFTAAPSAPAPTRATSPLP